MYRKRGAVRQEKEYTETKRRLIGKLIAGFIVPVRRHSCLASRCWTAGPAAGRARPRLLGPRPRCWLVLRRPGLSRIL